MSTMQELIDDVHNWLHPMYADSQANKLRCAAYCAMEDGYTLDQFLAACVANGVVEGTARNRWHEVRRREAAA